MARGFRRVVASPLPRDVLEAEVIRRLFEGGTIVIAAGGGGIPVALLDDSWYGGVEAVVDKDFTSSLLARQVGATRIVDLTGVDYIKLHFRSSHEMDLRALSVSQARFYLAEGHFLAGSMKPKVEAAIDFLEHGGREVVVTLPELLLEAIQGVAGTHIYPD